MPPKKSDSVVTADDLTTQATNKEESQKEKPLLEVDGRIIPDADVPTEYVQGVLEIMPEGHGVIRPSFTPSRQDVYISASQIRRFGLREGDIVGGQARAPKENERWWGMLKVEKINGIAVEEWEGKARPWFADLVPIFPQPQIKLETGPEPLSTRIVDLIAPIGFGQRALIVSPPKAGKTWLLKDIAAAVAKNYPEIHLMAVLIGERPEEVTDIRRHLATVSKNKGEVVASNFDEQPTHQVRAAEIALERAKRLVEQGRDVFVLLDSITRLARAYNLSIPTSGRTLTGGFDPAALYPAKRFFGAARNIENGGSLTIVGTCLIDTGSKMDDLIYEEFKGTGNMELHLDRKLADAKIFPAIDVFLSGTRHDELLHPKEIYPHIQTLYRMLRLFKDKAEALEAMISRLKKTKSNQEFLQTLKDQL